MNNSRKLNMSKKIKILVLFIITFLFLFFMAFLLLGRNYDGKSYFTNLLQKADIRVNGDRPWDIKIHNEKLFDRVLSQGSLGLGEAYMEGWWDCDSLDQFFYKILDANLDTKIGLDWITLCHIVKTKLINYQSKARSLEVAEQHYDLDNNLFELMLDPHMQYSCGYWNNCDNLETAQEQKLDLICKKLYLKPGMKVLDIGCGWGGLARFAAQKYGVTVIGITISKEQAKYAQNFCKDLPVTIRLQDYRDLNESFDRIVSVGMFEHVGVKNYLELMKIVRACLKKDGLFLLHTIGTNISTTSFDPWLHKYIFPNGQLPSVKQISQAAEGLFILEDWHNFGINYDKTLMAWHDKFNDNWDTLKLKYDNQFYRKWKYYLLSCAGLFRARHTQLWQIVFSRDGVKGGYISVR